MVAPAGELVEAQRGLLRGPMLHACLLRLRHRRHEVALANGRVVESTEAHELGEGGGATAGEAVVRRLRGRDRPGVAPGLLGSLDGNQQCVEVHVRWFRGEGRVEAVGGLAALAVDALELLRRVSDRRLLHANALRLLDGRLRLVGAVLAHSPTGSVPKSNDRVGARLGHLVVHRLGSVDVGRPHARIRRLDDRCPQGVQVDGGRRLAGLFDHLALCHNPHLEHLLELRLGVDTRARGGERRPWKAEDVGRWRTWASIIVSSDRPAAEATEIAASS